MQGRVFFLLGPWIPASLRGGGGGGRGGSIQRIGVCRLRESWGFPVDKTMGRESGVFFSLRNGKNSRKKKCSFFLLTRKKRYGKKKKGECARNLPKSGSSMHLSTPYQRFFLPSLLSNLNIACRKKYLTMSAPYRWSQTNTEVEVTMPLPDGVKGKQVKFVLKDQKLTLGYLGEVVIDGLMYNRVNVDDATWDIDDEQGTRVVKLTIAKSTYGDPWKYLTLEEASEKKDQATERTHTHKVFLDVQFETSSAPKRIVIGLFGGICPRTVENFRCLCTGEKVAQDARLHYKGIRFHKAISEFLIEAGDLVHKDGTGGLSIYDSGKTFQDENFIIPHDREGVVGMANANVANSNASSFYITLGPKDHLDNRRVAFGEVLEGMNVVKEISTCGDPVGRSMLEEVVIVDCGELPVSA